MQSCLNFVYLALAVLPVAFLGECETAWGFPWRTFQFDLHDVSELLWSHIGLFLVNMDAYWLQKATAGAGRARGRCGGSGACTCRPCCGRSPASSTPATPPAPRRSSAASPRTRPSYRRSSPRRCTCTGRGRPGHPPPLALWSTREIALFLFSTMPTLVSLNNFCPLGVQKKKD